MVINSNVQSWALRMFKWLDVYVAERNLETVNTCALKNIVNIRCWSISIRCTQTVHAEPKSIIDQIVCRPNGKPIWTEIAFKVHDTYLHFQQIYENWYYQRRPEKQAFHMTCAASNKHTASRHFFFFCRFTGVVRCADCNLPHSGQRYIGIFYNYVFVLVLCHRIIRRL